MYTDSSRAALLYSLEGVICAVVGYVFLHETLSHVELLGCSLMFFAAVLSSDALCTCAPSSPPSAAPEDHVESSPSPSHAQSQDVERAALIPILGPSARSNADNPSRSSHTTLTSPSSSSSSWSSTLEKAVGGSFRMRGSVIQPLDRDHRRRSEHRAEKGKEGEERTHILGSSMSPSRTFGSISFQVEMSEEVGDKKGKSGTMR